MRIGAAVLGLVAVANGCGGNSDTGLGDSGGMGNGSATGGSSSSGRSGSSGTTGGTTGTSAGSTGDDGGADGTTGGSSANTGGSISVTGGTTGTTGGSSGTLGTGGITSLCGDGGCVCSNGMDDDGDGLVDGLDPECIGPTDNDEGSFATGIPGDNQDPKWQDCFFDGNSGAGDDGCRYATECLTGELEQDDPDCQVVDSCIEFCVDRTPSGCDCFGCCTIGLEGGSNVDVLTVATCSIENIDDEEACPRCEKSTLCSNDCGECELCIGKTEADLPESCSPPPTGGGGEGGMGSGEGGAGNTPPPPSYTCDNDAQVCSETIACPANFYCRLGCCTELYIR
jgi:hypothetical protein